MSDMPARREQVVFPNPGVSSKDWYRDTSSSPLTRFVPALPVLGGIITGGTMLAVLIAHHVSRNTVLGTEEVGILVGIAFWPGLLLFWGLSHLISKRIAKRKERYRREHAQLLVSALAEQGWVADANNPVEELVKDDYPYFRRNSFCYRTHSKLIGDETVTWNFDIRDDRAEKLYKENALEADYAAGATNGN